jgi:hypothetical protein
MKTAIGVVLSVLCSGLAVAARGPVVQVTSAPTGACNVTETRIVVSGADVGEVWACDLVDVGAPGRPMLQRIWTQVPISADVSVATGILPIGNGGTGIDASTMGGAFVRVADDGSAFVISNVSEDVNGAFFAEDVQFGALRNGVVFWGTGENRVKLSGSEAGPDETSWTLRVPAELPTEAGEAIISTTVAGDDEQTIWGYPGRAESVRTNGAAWIQADANQDGTGNEIQFDPDGDGTGEAHIDSLGQYFGAAVSAGGLGFFGAGLSTTGNQTIQASGTVTLRADMNQDGTGAEIDIDPDGDGTIESYINAAGNFVGSVIGNASSSTTASALASNPSDCGSNAFATAIDASGNLTCSGGSTLAAAYRRGVVLRVNPTAATTTTAISEVLVGKMPPEASTITKCWVVPNGNVTGNNTNYQTVSVYGYDADGTNKVTVASFSTTIAGGGGWTQYVPRDFGSITNAARAANSVLTMEVTKTGTGQTFAANNVVACEYTTD